jgi:hypothetical protein
MKRDKALLYSPHFLISFLVCVGLLGVTAWSSTSLPSPAAKHKRDTPLIILQPSSVMLEHSGVGVISAIHVVSPDNQAIYLFNSFTGEAEIYREAPPESSRHFTSTSKPAPSGTNRYTAYQDKDSKVIILDSTGKQLAKFSTYPVYSLNVLSNGNLVVASPVGKNFLHLYDSTGKLLKSFGTINDYAMPEVDNAEKQFLHRGKVLIDGGDNIYYVFQYLPLIEKYSPEGKFLFERQVQGEAIDMQQELVQRFLRNQAPGSVGCIDVINSAALDPMTDHLWICMNGSSATGVVYEYSEQGDKLREYALEGDSPLPAMRRITGAKDIALTMSNLYVLTPEHVVLSFNIRDDSTWRQDSGDMTIQDPPPCGTAQTWNACTFTCPGLTCSGGQPTATSSDGSRLDCRQALQQALAPGYVLIQSTCTTYPQGYPGNPGQQIPSHMRGACKDEVTICRDGQNFTASVTVDCPTPANTCSGGGGGGGGCFFIDNCSEGTPNYDTCTCDPLSPILIDLQGNGFDLTDAAGGVSFDLNADSNAGHIAWTTANSDDALLVLDRNGNGIIDNGTELFGNITPQPPSLNRNGFAALAEYDKPQNGGNGDGQINARDAIFSSLRLWQDTNHNGISEPNELHTLLSLGLAIIELRYKESKRTDQYGNQFKYRAKVKDIHGAHLGRWAWDVFFVSQ